MQVWESLGGAGDLVQQCHSGISGPVRYVLPGKERSDRATERLKGATGMTFRSLLRTGTGLALVVLLAACGSKGTGVNITDRPDNVPDQFNPSLDEYGHKRSTVWDLFTNIDDPNTSLEVNRYLWNASLDVLSFMPVERVDPFSGLIVFGYGTPPGGGKAYRATVHVTDPALDARSLKVSLASKAGPADPDTVRAVEDAILTRARQMRIQHTKL